MLSLFVLHLCVSLLGSGEKRITSNHSAGLRSLTLHPSALDMRLDRAQRGKRNHPRATGDHSLMFPLLGGNGMGATSANLFLLEACCRPPAESSFFTQLANSRT